MRVFLFILVVLPTGWTFGYLLARLTEGQESVSPAGILWSLGAVLTPALMALLLFTQPERRALLKQVRSSFGALAYLVAVGFPVLVYVAGSVPPLIMAPGSTSLVPASSTLVLALQMLPMMLLWGGGFRGDWMARVSGSRAESFRLRPRSIAGRLVSMGTLARTANFLLEPSLRRRLPRHAFSRCGSVDRGYRRLRWRLGLASNCVPAPSSCPRSLTLSLTCSGAPLPRATVTR